MIAALALALLLAQSPEKHRGGAPAQDISITIPKTPETLVVPGETVWKMFAGLLAAVGGPLFGIGRWFINKHNAEIDALKKSVSEHVKQPEYEQNRQEMRTGIIELHKKIEGVNAVLIAKIDDVNSDAQKRHNEVMGILVNMR